MLSVAVILEGFGPFVHLLQSHRKCPLYAAVFSVGVAADLSRIRGSLSALITPPDTCSYQSSRAAWLQSTASIKSVQRQGCLFTPTVLILPYTTDKSPKNIPMLTSSCWCFALYSWLYLYIYVFYLICVDNCADRHCDILSRSFLFTLPFHGYQKHYFDSVILLIENHFVHQSANCSNNMTGNRNNGRDTETLQSQQITQYTAHNNENINAATCSHKGWAIIYACLTVWCFAVI